jgi:hypothetical protein
MVGLQAIEVNGRGKHSSLLRCDNNYVRKMFYSTGRGANVIKLFLSVIYGFSCEARVFQHRLEKFTNDKRSSLLWKSVIYGQKKFYNIGPWRDKVVNYFWRENLYSCLASDDNFNFCLQTGWPDWAIFQLLGYFLIGSLKKLPQNGNIFGYKNYYIFTEKGIW